jgi:hypothetical protein
VSEHPSQYALDRAALGAPVPPEVAAHLARCAPCASAIAARRAADPPPPWLESVRLAPARASRRRWGWLLPIPALAALAVAVPLAFRGDPAPGRGGDGAREKGAPAVTVYVKRGEQVAAWDGRTPIRPGDRLRVGVRGAGYAHLSVASLSAAPGEPALLYAGPLAPTGETLLPLAFRVDGRGRAEVLSVIASEEPVGLSAHGEPPDRARARGTWSVRLSIAKEVE